MDVSCLFHLNDYHWNIIIGKLIYADQLSLSETCQRFFNLIETKQINIRFQELFQKNYVSQEQSKDVIKEFIRKFKVKYYASVEQSDKLDLEYIFFILKSTLTPKKITAHWFWCQCNYSLKEDCKLCSQVIRFYDELPVIYMHSKHYTDLWDKEVEKVFSDELHYKFEDNKISADCCYFDNVYSLSQLVNLFGIIALRIFFNISKRFVFVTQLKQKQTFYKFFKAESRGIFSTVCDNIDIVHVENVLKVLKPFIDYDATYLKITNSYYIKYLEDK